MSSLTLNMLAALNGTQIALLVVGIVLLVAAAAVLAFLFLKGKKSKPSEAVTEDVNTDVDDGAKDARPETVEVVGEVTVIEEVPDDTVAAEATPAEAVVVEESVPAETVVVAEEVAPAETVVVTEEVVEEVATPAPEKKPAKTAKTAKPATSAKSAKTDKPATPAKSAKTDKPAKPAKDDKDEKAKPSTKTYHIAKRKEDGKWQIKAAGGEKAIKLFDTQKEAIDYCKTLADNQEANIMIHKEDGSFRKLTY